MLFKNINSLVSKSWKCFLMFYLEIRYLYLDNQSDCQITSVSNILLIFFDFAIFLKICQDTEVICILTLQASNINSAIFKVVKLSIAMEYVTQHPPVHHPLETHHDTWQNWSAWLTWDRNTMKKCFLSTYHPSCIVCRSVLVHSGQVATASYRTKFEQAIRKTCQCDQRDSDMLLVC